MVRGDHMSSLSREIEKYLKRLLERANNGVLEVQRSFLSEMFECVPSQINYVLSTRFTPAHGYIVETRRGGGGYIRIVRLNFDTDDKLKNIFQEIIGTSISQNQGEGLIDFLQNEGSLSRREAILIKNIVKDTVLSSTGIEKPDYLRAHILQTVLATLLREDLNK